MTEADFTQHFETLENELKSLEVCMMKLIQAIEHLAKQLQPTENDHQLLARQVRESRPRYSTKYLEALAKLADAAQIAQSRQSSKQLQKPQETEE